MKKAFILALFALFTFGNFAHSQETASARVVSSRTRELKNNKWSNWTNWVNTGEIIYATWGYNGKLSNFYIKDNRDEDNDMSFIVNYMSDSRFDNNGGEHLTGRITEQLSGARGTLEWYTYPSGTANIFTLKFPAIEIQYKTKDL